MLSIVDNKSYCNKNLHLQLNIKQGYGFSQGWFIPRNIDIFASHMTVVTPD